ncbi:YbjQ family protein [Candidatus Marsarchaeota archaeon]|nr:YbjQ family protein [Candidatus Marsarchaeota archaeon]
MVFTSDISTSDFWLLRDAGYVPIGLVLGNSVYSMGVLGSLATSIKGVIKGELTPITNLMHEAKALAIQRLADEAERLGADGVIGVKLKVEYMHNNEWMEITAIGTAVKKVDNGAFSGSPNKTKPIIATSIPIKSEEVASNF